VVPVSTAVLNTIPDMSDWVDSNLRALQASRSRHVTVVSAGGRSTLVCVLSPRGDMPAPGASEYGVWRDAPSVDPHRDIVSRDLRRMLKFRTGDIP